MRHRRCLMNISGVRLLFVVLCATISILRAKHADVEIVQDIVANNLDSACDVKVVDLPLPVISSSSSSSSSSSLTPSSLSKLASSDTVTLHRNADDGLEDYPIAIRNSLGDQLPHSKFGVASRTFHFTSPLSSRDHGDVEIQVLQNWDEIGLGCVVWEAAEVLARYLVATPRTWERTSVLELGAGIGLSSLVAWKLGAHHVVATDRLQVLECTTQNQRLNNATDGRFMSAPLLWGSQVDLDNAHDIFREAHNTFHDDHGHHGDHNCRQDGRASEGFDLVIGSDLVYDESVFPVLVETLEAFATPQTTILLSGKRRYRKRFALFRKLLEHRFSTKQLPIVGTPSHYLFSLTLRHE